MFCFSWTRIFTHDGSKFKEKFFISTLVKLGVISALSFALSTSESIIVDMEYEILYLDETLMLTLIKVCLSPATLVLNYFITKYFIEKFMTGREATEG